MIANVQQIRFKIERDLDEQYGALPLPFPGMDSMFTMKHELSLEYSVMILLFLHIFRINSCRMSLLQWTRWYRRM